MVEINIVYEGQLRCHATHGPSAVELNTDAPKDNMGKGESFSPTDLLATSLGACMLTIMGIVAQKQSLDISGTTVKVTKEMVAQPFRRVGKLGVKIHVPHAVGDDDKRRLEAAALACPVAKSIHPDIQVPTEFTWGVD